jgi:hypothetical protein
MPSILGHAGDHGVAWRAYAASGNYPVASHAQLQGSPNVLPSSQFVADARAGSLSPLPAQPAPPTNG